MKDGSSSNFPLNSEIRFRFAHIRSTEIQDSVNLSWFISLQKVAGLDLALILDLEIKSHMP